MARLSMDLSTIDFLLLQQHLKHKLEERIKEEEEGRKKLEKHVDGLEKHINDLETRFKKLEEK